ncbi:MAG TPA: DUF2894 domain-containing protein [Stenotrophomonas sp.]|jgi:hypothetical protein
MRAESMDAALQLAQWRREGGDRLDPMRFRFIDALARRAPQHEGAARRLIDQRLSHLLQTYADELAAAQALAAEPASAAPDIEEAKSDRGPLAELLAQVATQRTPPVTAGRVGAGTAGTAGASDPLSVQDAFPALPALAEFRQLWTGLLAERQLRQSMARVPVDAGPLNSGVLVHRAITLMRTLSPEYLRHFLAYTEHLSWMERLHHAHAPSRPAVASVASGRKAAPRKASKPRKKRGE